MPAFSHWYLEVARYLFTNNEHVPELVEQINLLVLKDAWFLGVPASWLACGAVIVALHALGYAHWVGSESAL